MERSQRHRCLVCGELIEPSNVDPVSAVLSAAPRPGAETPKRRGNDWWKRPPGQYWLHATCLRTAAHRDTELHFLDIAEQQ